MIRTETWVHECTLDAGVYAQQYMKAERPVFLILSLGNIRGGHFALLAWFFQDSEQKQQQSCRDVRRDQTFRVHCALRAGPVWKIWSADESWIKCSELYWDIIVFHAATYIMLSSSFAKRSLYEVHTKGVVWHRHRHTLEEAWDLCIWAWEWLAKPHETYARGVRLDRSVLESWPCVEHITYSARIWWCHAATQVQVE